VTDRSTLSTHFRSVFLISLRYCDDRRERAVSELLRSGLIASEDEVTHVAAVSGDRVGGGPAGWPSGNGAWGCLRSHQRCLEDAAGLDALPENDPRDSYVVIEDDVIFHDRSAEMFHAFMAEANAHRWGQLYFGGQHLKEPRESGNLLIPANVNRTHMFAAHRRAYQVIQRHIAYMPDYEARTGGWHIDHQLGVAHERRSWLTLAPRWWIAGQGEGPSNVSGQNNPDKWWFWNRWRDRVPVVVVPANMTRGRLDVWHDAALHFGWGCDELTDSGLANAMQVRSAHDDTAEDARWERGAMLQRLKNHIAKIATESMDLWRMPAVCHPGLTPDLVREVWPDAIALEDLDRTDAESWPFGGRYQFETASCNPKP